MRISAAGPIEPRSTARRAAGFTLVELLVVVVIVAVLAAAVGLALAGSGGERQLEREAERLHALLGHACERAETSGREIGLSLARDGYVFSEFDRGAWQPLEADELRQRRWVAGLGTQLSRDGVRVAITTDFPDKPQLVCFSSGELTPFRIELMLADPSLHWYVEGEPDGTLTLERRDAPR